MSEIWIDSAETAVKTAVSAVVLFALARLMGKKQISHLTFFDYIVGISIGSVAAAVSVDRRIPLHSGIVSMIVWAIFPIAFSSVSLHSMIARRLLDGTPKVLIQNGKIVEKNLRKSKFTVNDLLEELRQKDVFNIADVEFAVLETSGKLSVLKKACKQPASAEMLSLTPSQLGITANLIIDGKMMRENMAKMNVDETWLLDQLQKNRIFSVRDVLLANCDDTKVLHIDRKRSDPDGRDVFQ